MDDEINAHTPSGPSQPSAGTTPLAGSGSGTSTAPSQGNPTPTASVQSSSNPSNSTTATPSLQNSKRRRGLGVVTPNACTECRKKRAKVLTNPLLSLPVFSFNPAFHHIQCSRLTRDPRCFPFVSSAMDKDLVDAASYRKMSIVYTKFLCVSRKRTSAQKSRACACASALVTKYSPL